MRRVRRGLSVSFALLGVFSAAPAWAQQPLDGTGTYPQPYQPQPYQPQPYQPQPYQPAPPSGPVVAPPYQPYQPLPPAIQPTQPPVVQPAEPGTPTTLPPPLFAKRFRTGRIVYNIGSTVGLIGSGLSLTGVGLSFAYGVSNLTLGLSYAGSSARGTGSILAAVGLGLQHSALRVAGADTGRGLYAAGTVFSILGLAGIGASYYFGGVYSTDALNTTSGAVAFGTSVGAAVLLGVGSILYFVDARRMLRASQRLTRF